MLFLNAMVLLGLLAVAVPIILHLLNRKAARVLDWGAVQFLLDSLVIRRRRILLEEVLLLVARCLLVALVVLAVARPFVPASSRVPWGVVLPCALGAIAALGASVALWRHPRWRWTLTGLAAAALLFAAAAYVRERLRGGPGGANGRQDVALILDGSDSMRLVVDGRSQFERAVDEAARLIRQAPRGTTFSLVLGADAPQRLTPTPSTDRAALAALLTNLQPAGGTLGALDTLSAAVGCLADGLYPDKQIVLIGDAQRHGWELDQPARWELLRGVCATLPAPPRVLYRTLRGRPAVRNAAVTAVRVGRGCVGVDREIEIEVRVENTGTEPLAPGAVTVHAGGAVLVDRSLGTLDPGVAGAVRVRQRFARPGSQVVRAEIGAVDDLPADNVRTVVKHVLAGIPVLVVDGGAGAAFLERPGACVALALAPARATAEALPTEPVRAGSEPVRRPPPVSGFVLQPELVSAAAFAEMADFSPYGAIILADVPQLPNESALRLEQFVRHGGGLLITPGLRTLPDAWNAWREGDGRAFLPAALGASCAPTNDSVGLSPETFGHPAVAWLADRRGDLGEARIRRYWRLEAGAAQQGVGICARLTNGDAYLVERQVGRGSVLLLAGALDLRDTDLATRRGFVPLLNEVGQYLTRAAETRLTLPPAPELAIPLFGAGGGRRTSGGGLLGEYFTGRFDRRIAVRLDAGINVDWRQNAPVDGLGPDNFSVRWTGTLQPPRTGVHRFEAEVDDRLTLWLNEKRVFGTDRQRPDQGHVTLKAGVPYAVRVEFQEDGGEAYARLFWTPPRGQRALVPADVLSPSLGLLSGSLADTCRATGPDGASRPVRLDLREGELLARLGGNIVPGLYSLALPAAVARVVDGDASATNRTLAVAVAGDPDESRLAPQTPDDVRFVQKYVRLELPESVEQLQRALAGQTTGRELWKYLAVAALLLLVLEIVLTRWIARQRRMDSDETVDFEGYLAPSASFQEQVAKVKRGNS